jgi:hypothetical protein
MKIKVSGFIPDVWYKEGAYMRLKRSHWKWGYKQSQTTRGEERSDLSEKNIFIYPLTTKKYQDTI